MTALAPTPFALRAADIQAAIRRGAGVLLGRPWCRWLLVAALGFQPNGSPEAQAADPLTTIRLGISLGTRPGINPNDAEAAIQSWARTTLRIRGLAITTESRMFDSVEPLQRALAADQIEAAAVVTDEFLSLDDRLKPDHVLVSVRAQSPAEHYLLIAHQSTPWRQPSDIHGRKIIAHHSSRTALAPIWLETLFVQPGESFDPLTTQGLTRLDSAPRTILSVFFRQADAALVTSNAFQVACELNPQIRSQLRVIATSPEVIPNLFFFRNTFRGTLKDELEAAIVDLPDTPAGRQVLAVFQCDRMVRQPRSCLDGTQTLVDLRHRLRTGAAPTPASAAPDPPEPLFPSTAPRTSHP